MANEFDINELSLKGDGYGTSKNDTNQFTNENLLKVGTSPELANALDKVTIAELQQRFIDDVDNGNDVNLEMYQFVKEVYASYHDTGYETNEAKSAVNWVEKTLDDEGSALGLRYDYDTSSVVNENDTPNPMPDFGEPSKDSGIDDQDVAREVLKDALGFESNPFKQ